MVPQTIPTKQLVTDYLEIWNERSYDAIPDLVSDSFVMYDPFAPGNEVPGPAGEVHGPAGLETFIRGTVRGFPDFRVEVITMLSDEGLGMYEGLLRMTHDGEFFGIPPTGGHAEVRYMGSVRVTEGMVVEHRVYPPLRAILGQLGLNFPGVLILGPRLAWGKLRQLVA